MHQNRQYLHCACETEGPVREGAKDVREHLVESATACYDLRCACQGLATRYLQFVVPKTIPTAAVRIRTGSQWESWPYLRTQAQAGRP